MRGYLRELNYHRNYYSRHNPRGVPFWVVVLARHAKVEPHRLAYLLYSYALSVEFEHAEVVSFAVEYLGLPTQENYTK